MLNIYIHIAPATSFYNESGVSPLNCVHTGKTMRGRELTLRGRKRHQSLEKLETVQSARDDLKEQIGRVDLGRKWVEVGEHRLEARVLNEALIPSCGWNGSQPPCFVEMGVPTAWNIPTC